MNHCSKIPFKKPRCRDNDLYCDDDGLIAYLESSNPRNLSLYERHGFEIIGKIQAGTSPTLYPMIREAQL